MTMHACRVLRAMLAGVLGGSAVAAAAQPLEALDRFNAGVGLQYRASAVTVGLQWPFAAPQLRDERRELAPDRLRGELLIGQSHGLVFDHAQTFAHREWSAAGTFAPSGHPLGITANASGSARASITGAYYRYWFGSQRTAFGIGVGAAYLRLDARAQGGGTIGGLAFDAADAWRERQTAPVLALGLRHVAFDTVRLYADATGIDVSSSGSHWRVFSGSAGVEWFALPNLGIGVEYGLRDLRLTQPGELARDIEIRSHGPALYMRGRF
ncbi:MAG TPA: hypothetical protein VM491_01150 [Burkholderiaceae bacterium]|nr:hypothetical protein [Burkholderiaceae bacterium]